MFRPVAEFRRNPWAGQAKVLPNVLKKYQLACKIYTIRMCIKYIFITYVFAIIDVDIFSYILAQI